MNHILMKYLDSDETIELDINFDYKINLFKNLLEIPSDEKLIYNNNKGIIFYLETDDDIKNLINDIIENRLEIIKLNNKTLKIQLEFKDNENEKVISINSQEKELIDNFELIDSFDEIEISSNSKKNFEENDSKDKISEKIISGNNSKKILENQFNNLTENNKEKNFNKLANNEIYKSTKSFEQINKKENLSVKSNNNENKSTEIKVDISNNIFVKQLIESNKEILKEKTDKIKDYNENLIFSKENINTNIEKINEDSYNNDKLLINNETKNFDFSLKNKNNYDITNSLNFEKQNENKFFLIESQNIFEEKLKNKKDGKDNSKIKNEEENFEIKDERLLDTGIENDDENLDKNKDKNKDNISIELINTKLEKKCFYCQILIENISYYFCQECNLNKCYICNDKFNKHNHKLNFIHKKDEIDYYNQVLLETQRLIQNFSLIMGKKKIILNFKEIINFRNLVKIFGENKLKIISKLFYENKTKEIYEIQNLIEDKIYN